MDNFGKCTKFDILHKHAIAYTFLMFVKNGKHRQSLRVHKKGPIDQSVRHSQTRRETTRNRISPSLSGQSVAPGDVSVMVTARPGLVTCTQR